jgi:hypothetical protein
MGAATFSHFPVDLALLWEDNWPGSGDQAAPNTSRCSASFLRSPKLIGQPKGNPFGPARLFANGLFVRMESRCHSRAPSTP